MPVPARQAPDLDAEASRDSRRLRSGSRAGRRAETRRPKSQISCNRQQQREVSRPKALCRGQARAVTGILLLTDVAGPDGEERSNGYRAEDGRAAKAACRGELAAVPAGVPPRGGRSARPDDPANDRRLVPRRHCPWAPDAAGVALRRRPAALL